MRLSRASRWHRIQQRAGVTFPFRQTQVRHRLPIIGNYIHYSLALSRPSFREQRRVEPGPSFDPMLDVSRVLRLAFDQRAIKPGEHTRFAGRA